MTYLGTGEGDGARPAVGCSSNEIAPLTIFHPLVDTTGLLERISSQTGRNTPFGHLLLEDQEEKCP
jgi:hypothetical protein